MNDGPPEPAAGAAGQRPRVSGEPETSSAASGVVQTARREA